MNNRIKRGIWLLAIGLTTTFGVMGREASAIKPWR